mgnify:CR=1 FL=1
MQSSLYTRRGFTLVELLTVIAIITIITSVLMTGWGNSRETQLITNNAYEIAIEVREAQKSGQSVLQRPGSGATYAYGIHIPPRGSAGLDYIVQFSDLNENDAYDAGEEVETLDFESGVVVKAVCLIPQGSPDFYDVSVSNPGWCTGNAASAVDVLFKRPLEDALIKIHPSGPSNYAGIEFVVGSDATSFSKVVNVLFTGQISVLD